MVDILLKAVEIKKGISVDVIEGSVPKEQADNCKIGEILNSTKVSIDSQEIGDQQWKITKREELQTEIGVDYVRLEIERCP